ncbi:fumarylacetoacetate hydrolase family protein [Celerinatantimonas diazotrophica]|uniref:2-keto-4-pentenoate hydratase/2-oxohepta-3-ene-1,7-dioic acid hydratase in catechol pathway n=1 Tax=Celerinatantimonas diazotrophica TaxID=412034 RepID=A0A4R1J7J9_9GAMM|nr:fumarylacetoacetate hydrolase family protein [Celerinatantimonas diazotrophica]TCK46403.1 2-keto-4-pentenoate hydratase/2-oxohepta-3-ene-1,7-dioic acid hydratase in catechol pathway [Celerinatantimonas diazotrophica]CAG9295221.1 hypothetical protein CEDIAZO_00333 [Celerinatantimonas diazotrophica]
MNIANYLHQGTQSYGIVTDQGIIDLGRKLAHSYPDLKSLLQDDALDQIRSYASSPVDFAIEDIDFLPVIANPGKILCVGMNYAQKRLEFDETSPAPTLFVRFPDSQTGHQQPILKPAYSTQFDYEGELAVIIGRGGYRISQAQALNHVAGYSCYMDGSARDWQHTWFTAGKNWRQSGGFGPWMTTADEIPDPQTLTIQTYLNGQQVQSDSTANMVHPVAELIAYISTFSELSAGDVIITGSPGGVGKMRHPPLFLNPGDRIEVSISEIGTLSNPIVDDVDQQPNLLMRTA